MSELCCEYTAGISSNNRKYFEGVLGFGLKNHGVLFNQGSESSVDVVASEVENAYKGRNSGQKVDFSKFGKNPRFSIGRIR